MKEASRRGGSEGRERRVMVAAFKLVSYGRTIL